MEGWGPRVLIGAGRFGGLDPRLLLLALVAVFVPSEGWALASSWSGCRFAVSLVRGGPPRLLTLLSFHFLFPELSGLDPDNQRGTLSGTRTRRAGGPLDLERPYHLHLELTVAPIFPQAKAFHLDTSTKFRRPST